MKLSFFRRALASEGMSSMWTALRSQARRQALDSAVGVLLIVLYLHFYCFSLICCMIIIIMLC